LNDAERISPVRKEFFNPQRAEKDRARARRHGSFPEDDVTMVVVGVECCKKNFA
jgi:hypothetical protein